MSFFNEISARLAALSGSATPVEALESLNEFDVRDIQAVRVSEGGGGNGGSQPLEIVRLTVAHNTPGLIIPGSGPVGVKLCDLAEGDAILGLSTGGDDTTGTSSLRTITPWDGTGTSLRFVTTGDRGNMPGTPPGPWMTNDGLSGDSQASPDGSLLYSRHGFSNFGNAANAWANAATSIYVYVDDGSGGDPGATMGESEIILLVVRAA